MTVVYEGFPLLVSAPLPEAIADPTDIVGCEVWLDADDDATFTYSSGAVVQEWADKSGTGNDFTDEGVPSTAPSLVASTLNGRPAVTFNSDYLICSTLALTEPFTVFTVIAWTDDPGGDFRGVYEMGDSGTPPWLIRRNDGSFDAWAGAGGAFPTETFPVTTDEPYYITQVVNDAASETMARKNGVVQFSGLDVGFTAVIPSTRIGRSTSGSYMVGFIAEFIIYDRALSTAEIELVEQYLNLKWFTPSITDPTDLVGLYNWYDADDPATLTTYVDGYETIALVVSAETFGANGGTTGAVDTTGATLLVAVTSKDAAGTLTVSDSKGNIWTPLTNRNTNLPYCRIYYVANPIVGTGHTFTIGGASTQSAAEFAAFSGVLTVSPFDQETGNGGTGLTDSSTPGSITPSEDGCLLIFGGTNGLSTLPTVSGYTIYGQEVLHGSVAFGVTAAYQIQTTATASNPSWVYGVGSYVGQLALASFKPAPASLVDEWADKSDNALELTTSAVSAAPEVVASAINGRTAIYWDGQTPSGVMKQDFGGSLYSQAQPLTIFFVVQFDSDGEGTYPLVMEGGSSGFTIHRRGGDSDQLVAGDSSLTGYPGTLVPITSDEPHLVAVVFDSVDSLLRLNQVEEWQTDVGTDGINGTLLVGDQTVSNSRMWGYVGEIVIYDRHLSDAEIDLVETYLYNKWFVLAVTRRRTGVMVIT